jgi:hypothetical protein
MMKKTSEFFNSSLYFHLAIALTSLSKFVSNGIRLISEQFLNRGNLDGRGVWDWDLIVSLGRWLRNYIRRQGTSSFILKGNNRIHCILELVGSRKATSEYQRGMFRTSFGTVKLEFIRAAGKICRRSRMKGLRLASQPPFSQMKR